MQGEQASEGAGVGGADQVAELKEKVNSLSRLFTQLEDARTANRRTKVGVVLVILLVLLGYGIFIYSQIAALYKEKQDDIKAQMTQSAGRLLITAKGQLLEIAKKVYPTYRDELQKQLQTRAPELKELFIKEAEGLVADIKDNGLAPVEERLTQMAERQQERIQKAFPVLADEEAVGVVIENLASALRGAADDVLAKRVEKGEERLRAINDKILAFLPEGDREGFEVRLRKAWEDFLMYDVPEMLEGK